MGLQSGALQGVQRGASVRAFREGLQGERSEPSSDGAPSGCRGGLQVWVSASASERGRRRVQGVRSELGFRSARRVGLRERLRESFHKNVGTWEKPPGAFWGSSERAFIAPDLPWWFPVGVRWGFSTAFHSPGRPKNRVSFAVHIKKKELRLN